MPHTENFTTFGSSDFDVVPQFYVEKGKSKFIFDVSTPTQGIVPSRKVHHDIKHLKDHSDIESSTITETELLQADSAPQDIAKSHVIQTESSILQESYLPRRLILKKATSPETKVRIGSSTALSNRGLISFLKNNSEIYESERLIDRITTLLELVDEPDQKPMNPKSLLLFANFVIDNRIIDRPNITLTDEGYINAIWRKSREQLFEVEFLPETNEAYYVIYTPKILNPTQTIKRSAVVPVPLLFQTAEHYHLTNWLRVASEEITYNAA